MDRLTTEIWRQEAPDIAGQAFLDAPLAAHTTYRIGGPAAVLLTPASVEDVVAASRWAHEHDIPLVTLGHGSNVLAPDAGINALVLKLGAPFDAITVMGDTITAQAGASDEQLALAAADAGLAPFAWLYDIPGTVGGAVAQNAGMFDWDLSQVLRKVRHVSPTGELLNTPADEIELGYRTSAFKHRLQGHVIVEATFHALERGEPARLRAAGEEIRQQRQSKYPLQYPNCGSVFKRPPGNYAGRLIEAAGCGGLTIGQAMVSPKHRNFIANLGGATAADVKALVAEIQRRVHEHSGVLLERELVYLEDIIARCALQSSGPGHGAWPAPGG